MTGQHEFIYYIRHTASGPSSFLIIEIKTEAVKSIVSHNGYKYSYFLIMIYIFTLKI